jgi:hypothetical protein
MQDGSVMAPVLIAIGEPTLRIEVAAALVVNGFRIVLARTGRQLVALLPSAAVVVADDRLLAAAAPRARRALERVRIVAIDDADEVDAVVAAAYDAVA